MIKAMQAEPTPQSRRAHLIAAAALAAFATFYLIEEIVGGDGPTPILLMCLACYAASGLGVIRAFHPTLVDAPPANKSELRLRLLASALAVTGAVAVACIGALAARGLPDLRLLFGGLSIILFGFAALEVLRAIVMVRDHRRGDSRD